MARNKVVKVLLTEEELLALDQKASSQGLDRANFIRWLVKIFPLADKFEQE